MSSFIKGRTMIMTCALGAGIAGISQAGEVLVTSDISTSTTWTKDNTYNLQSQIYVTNGATLTIEAGTIVASDTNVGGSLAVTRGSRIHAVGTKDEPIIFTSKADVATWAGTVMAPFTPGDPSTGTWRESANEWGNLTIMGRAYISENAVPGNVPTPNANNVAVMEGLTEAFPGDTRVLYGGGDDDDDSGTLRYVSTRYTGKVIALNNELNGLSLGGIGRGTDLSHLDVMNNVDDGIEIWGGTVNLKYFSIWNIGDDSLDVDQGWRGKAQFGLIIQGHCLDAPSGSGVCDNSIEMDGAENSDWQPVTTVTLYNLTVIGQPVGGDHATAWRDNARVQIRNSIFMDTGRNLVNLDNVDGDGGQGYGFNGTLTWAQTWTTDYNAVPAHANDPAPGLGGWLGYPAQSSGKLAEITDSVFFRNLFSTAYDEANARGVFSPANNNVLVPGFDPADAPINSISRGAAVVRGGRTMLPVLGLDPRPANAALTSVAAAPADGFFTPAQYRGAFHPGEENWLCGWSSLYAFGVVTDCGIGRAYCFGDGSTTACPCSNPGSTGHGCGNSSFATGARIQGSGTYPGAVTISVENAKPSQFALVLRGSNKFNPAIGIFDGLLCVGGQTARSNAFFTSASGTGTSPVLPAGPAGVKWNYQVWYRDTGLCNGSNLSNGLEIIW